MFRICFQITLLDALDDIDQRCIGRRGNADFFALPNDQAVKEFDLRATALDHVLTHRRTVFAAAGFGHFGQPMLVVFLHRRRIAFAGARDDFWIDVILAREPAVIAGLVILCAVAGIYAFLFQATVSRLVPKRVVDVLEVVEVEEEECGPFGLGGA